MKMILLMTQSGDWEGLYLDGELLDQGHSLGEGDAPRYWLNLAAKYDIDGSFLIEEELNDADSQTVYEYGCMPDHLDKFKGCYLHDKEHT